VIEYAFLAIFKEDEKHRDIAEGMLKTKKGSYSAPDNAKRIQNWRDIPRSSKTTL